MASICENIQQIKSEIGNTQLVVVSKYRSLQELDEVFQCGHLDFGENRVQELVAKAEALSDDIRWHLIGHLQTNKVKYIAPFVHLIQSVDTEKLLLKIDQEAAKSDRIIQVLLQVHIAEEEHKFGFSPSELKHFLCSDTFANLKHVSCIGLMGMATNTSDTGQLQSEFDQLNTLFQSLKVKHGFEHLSMGMSGDYPLAVKHGSTMVRIGSKVFN